MYICTHAHNTLVLFSLKYTSFWSCVSDRDCCMYPQVECFVRQVQFVGEVVRVCNIATNFLLTCSTKYSEIFKTLPFWLYLFFFQYDIFLKTMFCYVALAGLELTMQARLASNLQHSSCLCLTTAGNIAVCHHALLFSVTFASGMWGSAGCS